MASDLTVTLVLIMSALILSQALFLLAASIGIKLKLSRFRARAQTQHRRLIRLLSQVKSQIEKVQPATENLRSWQNRIEDDLHKVSEAARKTDSAAARALNVARQKLEVFTEESDRALILFSQVTHEVHKAVSEPSRRLAATLSALHSRVPGWVKRHSDRPEEPASGEQLFI